MKICLYCRLLHWRAPTFRHLYHDSFIYLFIWGCQKWNLFYPLRVGSWHRVAISIFESRSFDFWNFRDLWSICRQSLSNTDRRLRLRSHLAIKNSIRLLIYLPISVFTIIYHVCIYLSIRLLTLELKIALLQCENIINFLLRRHEHLMKIIIALRRMKWKRVRWRVQFSLSFCPTIGKRSCEYVQTHIYANVPPALPKQWQSARKWQKQ